MGEGIPGHTKERTRAIAERSGLLSALFASAPEGMAFLDAGLIVRAANESFARQMRRPIGEILGRPAEEVIAGWAEPVARILCQVRDAGQPFTAQAYPLVLAGQCERDVTYWDLTVSPVRDPDGTFQGYLLLHHDVSGRQRADQERKRLLQESARREALLAAIFESAGVGLALVAPDDRVLMANAQWLSCTGLQAEQAIGASILDLFPEVRDLTAALHARARSGEVVAVPRHWQHIAGRETCWEGSVSPVPMDSGMGTLITAREVSTQVEAERRLERALAENRSQREFLERLIEAAPIGIAVVRGPEHRYELVNPAYQAIPGAPTAPMLGRTVAEVYPDVPAAPALLDQVYRTGQPVSVREFEASVGPGREQTYWDADFVPLRGPGGQVERILILAVDVTDQVVARRRAEELASELAVERARLRAIIDNAPEAIVVADEQARVLLTNPVADRLYARPVPYGEVFQSHALLQIIYPDGTPYDPRDLPLTRSALDGETHTGVELAIIWPTGERRDLLVNTAPIRDPDGRITGAVGLFQDITERKRVTQERERLLREVETRAAQFDAIIAAIADGLIIHGPQGEILRINATGEHILGLSPEERARPLAERVARLRIENAEGEPVAPSEAPVARALRGETVLEAVLVLHHPDGKAIWTSASAAPIRAADGAIRGAVATLTDITAQRELQQRITHLYEAERQARAEAEAAVRARDQFLAAAAHELRTPVANLRGFAQLTARRLAREATPDPERTRQALRIVDQQADRLARLVSQLLDVANMETGEFRLEPQQTDLAGLVRHVAADAQAATRRHTLNVRAPESAPACVDPRRFEIVLHNLIDNAARFSPEDTPIDVDLSAPTPGTLRLSVRDRGPGIPPERRERLFSRFYQAQTGRPFAGLGLGLYYSRQIAELHGGQIAAEFPPEGGTRVTISLPDGSSGACSNGEQP